MPCHKQMVIITGLDEIHLVYPDKGRAYLLF